MSHPPNARILSSGRSLTSLKPGLPDILSVWRIEHESFVRTKNTISEDAPTQTPNPFESISIHKIGFDSNFASTLGFMRMDESSFFSGISKRLLLLLFNVRDEGMFNTKTYAT
jgi:hypothetical protein